MTEPHTIFIPTRNRTQYLEKAIPHWLEQDLNGLYIVVEPQEYVKHRTFLRRKGWDCDVDIVKLKRDNRGVNYARNAIIRYGAKEGLSSVVMADDDLFPSKNSDINDLTINDDMIGVGACCSYYGLFLGNSFVKEDHDHVLVPGGWGYRMFLIDVDAALGLGNYDLKLRSLWGDNDMARMSMSRLGIGWYISTNVWYSSTAPRYAPGGIADLYGGNKLRRLQMEKVLHGYLNKKWGDRYINKPPKRIMCRWRRFLDDYVENWRDKAPWAKEK